MIYLVEDDHNIRKLICYALMKDGFEVKDFSCPSEFWSEMSNQKPELLLLDIMLPEEDGLSILNKIRNASETKNLPVIMITAKSSEYDKVTGLDAGADDYIAKPFGIMELTSRIRAVLRRTQPKKPKLEKYEFKRGDLYVNTEKYIVTVGNEEITLALKEFELLCALLQADGIVLSRDALFNQIWGYDFDGESRTVDVHIRKLRQKLGDSASMIETVKGIGYKIGGKKIE